MLIFCADSSTLQNKQILNMKKLIATFAACVALTSSAFAYSNLVGTSDISSVLGTYDLWSTGTVYAPNFNPATSSDFTANPTTLSTFLSNLESTGGVLRTIFLGKTAGYTLDYVTDSYNGSSSRTNVFNYINNSSTISFGDYVDLGIGKNSTIQLYMETQAGYEFPIFGASTNVAYSIKSYTVSEYLTPTDAAAGYYDVTTYVVGIEDLAAAQGSDWDYNDVVLAFQTFKPDGTPFTSPVPEPSTYGLIGAAGLLGLIAVRRFKSKK